MNSELWDCEKKMFYSSSQVWKTIFFVFFGSLKSRDIFLPSIKFSLNYHQQNFIYAFFKKITVKYLFE